MRKSEIQLHYAMLRHNGQTFRIMSTNFPELVPGHPSSDLFGFFGFGSGEFLSPNIRGIEDVRVRLVEFQSDDSMFSMTLLAVESNPDFIGFVDSEPFARRVILMRGDSNDIRLLDIPHFNWPLYTQLGVQEHAKEIVATMSRTHLAYPTHAEQVARCDEIRNYISWF